MKSDPQEPAELLNLLRQQLLLAQVRIMELEDARDELAPRLTETAALLAAAQSLVESKVDAAAHMEKVQTDLQNQLEHLRHVQHTTHTALEQTRAESARHAAANAALLSEVEQMHILTRQLAEAERRYLQQAAQLGAELNAAQVTANERLARLSQLNAEQRAMKTSRSWRWTAWLRSIERSSK